MGDTDQEESPRSLELTGLESSSTHNTAQNELETSRRRQSQRKYKGKMPVQRSALPVSDSDSDNLVRSIDDEHGDPATQTPEENVT